MDILKLANATRSLGKPADWDDSKGVCETLDVVDVEDANGAWMVSMWKPSAAELKALNEGAAIELWINGEYHPVVSVAVNGVRE